MIGARPIPAVELHQADPWSCPAAAWSGFGSFGKDAVSTRTSFTVSRLVPTASASSSWSAPPLNPAAWSLYTHRIDILSVPNQLYIILIMDHLAVAEKWLNHAICSQFATRTRRIYKLPRPFWPVSVPPGGQWPSRRLHKTAARSGTVRSLAALKSDACVRFAPTSPVTPKPHHGSHRNLGNRFPASSFRTCAQRRIAGALGVSNETVRRDLGVTKVTAPEPEPLWDRAPEKPPATYVTLPPEPAGDEVGQLHKRTQCRRRHQTQVNGPRTPEDPSGGPYVQFMSSRPSWANSDVPER